MFVVCGGAPLFTNDNHVSLSLSLSRGDHLNLFIFTGVGAYFYADMVHRTNLEGSTFNMVGPYKYFRDPMYGIGYIGTYGLGLW